MRAEAQCGKQQVKTRCSRHASRQDRNKLRSDMQCSPQEAVHKSATESSSHIACQGVAHAQNVVRQAVGAVKGQS